MHPNDMSRRFQKVKESVRFRVKQGQGLVITKHANKEKGRSKHRLLYVGDSLAVRVRCEADYISESLKVAAV